MHNGLYVHIPFCLKKCAYCDFASSNEPMFVHDEYFDALKKEISLYKDATIDSIFIGGGTPSCVDEKYICELFDTISHYMTIDNDAEITIEANPGTLDKNKLISYKSCAVNRISLGAQSLQDNELLSLGRIHNSKHIIDAISLIKECGFKNYNLDLMLATPNQTTMSLRDTLENAVSLSPTHISAYSLIIEEGTPFYEMYNKGALILPNEDEEREMYDMAVSFLNKHGYTQYEISNFAKPGYECSHNLKYWQCMPYIGIGAAAHSYYDGSRYANTTDTYEYIKMMNEKGNAQITNHTLNFDERVSDYIIMSLRLTKGIELDDFYNKFGFRFEEKYKEIIVKYVNTKFFERTNTHIFFTKRGFSVSNSILCEFV